MALPYLRLLQPASRASRRSRSPSCPTSTTSKGYVETTYAKRAGTSKFHFVSDAYRYILQVLRMVMYFDPSRSSCRRAIWLILLGVVKGVVDMVRHPSTSPANTVLLVVSGVMIGSLALLSDLVVRSRDGV